MRHEKPSALSLRYAVKVEHVDSAVNWGIWDNIKQRWAERGLEWDEAHGMAEYLETLDGDDTPDEYAGTAQDRAASKGDDRHQLKAENDNG